MYYSVYLQVSINNYLLILEKTFIWLSFIGIIDIHVLLSDVSDYSLSEIIPLVKLHVYNHLMFVSSI